MTNHRVPHLPHLPPAVSDWLMSDGILLELNCKHYVMTTLMTLTASRTTTTASTNKQVKGKQDKNPY